MKTQVLLSFIILIFLSSCYMKESETSNMIESSNSNVASQEESIETSKNPEIVSDLENESFLEVEVPVTETINTPEVTETSTVAEKPTKVPEEKIELTQDELLRARLTPIQYEVTQNAATEKAYQNAYWDNYEEGIYVDIIDGKALFSSTTKFKSDTGWPSFSAPISSKNIVELEDNLLWFTRTEVKGASSNSHLGHIFNDGPKDQGGLRYCINSASMKFIPKADMKAQGYQNYLYLFE